MCINKLKVVLLKKGMANTAELYCCTESDLAVELCSGKTQQQVKQFVLSATSKCISVPLLIDVQLDEKVFHEDTS